MHMKTSNKITVNAIIDDAWRVMADEFTHNDRWMAQVFKTRTTTNPNENLSARICELTPTLDGIRTDEKIIEYDKDNYKLVFTVAIENGGKLPVKNNVATVTMRELSGGGVEVHWATTPSLKPIGYILAPMLKLGIQKSFKEVLEEFKHYVETGEPHPRKVEAMKKVKA